MKAQLGDDADESSSDEDESSRRRQRSKRAKKSVGFVDKLAPNSRLELGDFEQGDVILAWWAPRPGQENLGAARWYPASVRSIGRTNVIIRFEDENDDIAYPPALCKHLDGLDDDS